MNLPVVRLLPHPQCLALVSMCLLGALSRGAETEAETAVGTILKEWQGAAEHKAQEEDQLVARLVALRTEAVPALMKTLASADEGTPAVALIRALGQLKDPQAVPALADVAAKGRKTSERVAALSAIAAIGGGSAVPLLLPLLDDTGSEVMPAVLTTLAGLARDRGIEVSLSSALYAAVKGAPETRQCEVIELLSRMRKRTAEPLLLQFLTQGSWRVRCSAMRVIGNMGASRGLSAAVLNILRTSQEPLEVKEAALALGRVGNVEAAADLIRLLNSSNQALREHALCSLQQLSACSFSGDPAIWTTWLEQQKKHGPEGLKSLTAALAAGDAKLAPLIIEDMASFRLQKDKVVPILLPCLQNGEFRVRAAACNVLGQLGAAEALPPLVGCLLDSSPEVSFAAWRALRHATGKGLPRDYQVWRAWLEETE